MLVAGCILVRMNQMSTAKRAAVVRSLVEGNSMRSTTRMTGAGKNTIARLLIELGRVCANYHDEHVRNVSAKRIECDEVWSYIAMKEKNIPERLQGEYGYGDVWLWTGIDSDSKLMVSYMFGMRDAESARDFMFDLAARLSNRVQLTTDGHGAYLAAVKEAFGPDGIDYAMLVKQYGNDPSAEKRYSPAVCTGCKKTPISGNPDKANVSTSYVERQNLTLRMQNRRFTRLTNGFSKKLENHEAAVALHYMYYNYARPHQTLTKGAGFKTTPAMAAGLADHVWSVEEIIGLLEPN
jgi:IS1 family transposase